MKKLKWSHIYKGMFIIISTLILLAFTDYYIHTPKPLYYSTYSIESSDRSNKKIILTVEYGDDQVIKVDDTLTTKEITDLVIQLNKSLK